MDMKTNENVDMKVNESLFTSARSSSSTTTTSHVCCALRVGPCHAVAAVHPCQVLIPDVQKLINQLGNVNTDLFASRLLRPPSSVLLLPLRASGVGECSAAAPAPQACIRWLEHMHEAHAVFACSHRGAQCMSELGAHAHSADAGCCLAGAC